MLHSNQICHLDMKTANILIGNDGTCKIADLGLGRIMDTKASLASVPEMATLVYMSPEHIRGQAGLASDIWSLSIILWEVRNCPDPFPSTRNECTDPSFLENSLLDIPLSLSNIAINCQDASLHV